MWLLFFFLPFLFNVFVVIHYHDYHQVVVCVDKDTQKSILVKESLGVIILDIQTGVNELPAPLTLNSIQTT